MKDFKKPIKVLHIVSEYLPISEQWIYRLIKHTPSAEASIFTTSYLQNDFYDPEITFLSYPDYGVLNSYQNLKINSAIDWIHKLFLKFILLVRKAPTKSLEKILVENQFDLVHSHFGSVGATFHKSIKKHNIPHVISFYGWDYEKLFLQYPRVRRSFTRIFQEISFATCEGNYSSKTLLSHGCPSNKIRILKLGVDLSSHPFTSKIKPKGELKLVQISAFAETKGILQVIRALGILKKKGINITYTLIGFERETGYLDKVNQAIKEENLHEMVKILPKIEYEQIPEIFENYHVFVHPSKYGQDMDCEGGSPTILLNAQSCGLPIISTFHCDIPEHVMHNKSGLLSEEGDIIALAANIEYFYEMEDEEYSKFQTFSREFVTSNYNIDENMTELKSYYDEAISKLS